MVKVIYNTLHETTINATPTQLLITRRNITGFIYLETKLIFSHKRKFDVKLWHTFRKPSTTIENHYNYCNTK